MAERDGINSSSDFESNSKALRNNEFIHKCVSYIKLDAQVVHCYFDTPRHRIRLSNSIKHYVYGCL